MTNRIAVRCCITLPLAAMVLAGCSLQEGAAIGAAALPAGTDPLADAAALLVAAEQAGSAASRQPILARLDAMQISAADGAEDDPLDGWRKAADPAADGTIFRGRALGPAYRRARLPAGSKLTLQQIFYAGQRAEIAAHTLGGQPVALAITDPRAEEICETRLAPRGSCRWLPLFTERFSIKLENPGAQETTVYIVFR